MNDPTQNIGNAIRIIMVHVARWLDKVSGGRIKPSHITTVSLLGHIPAAWLLVNGRPEFAAVYIVVFGLLDALDGALAREQKSATKLGMFYDATTDRLKEAILYAGLAVYVDRYVTDIAPWVVVAVAATSLLVSYVKAKGEMAIADNGKDTQALNREFTAGLARYEIRMLLLVIGLLTNLLAPLLNFIIALNLLTVATRFIEIARVLTTQDTEAKIQITKKHAED